MTDFKRKLDQIKEDCQIAAGGGLVNFKWQAGQALSDALELLESLAFGANEKHGEYEPCNQAKAVLEKIVRDWTGR